VYLARSPPPLLSGVEGVADSGAAAEGNLRPPAVLKETPNAAATFVRPSAMGHGREGAAGGRADWLVGGDEGKSGSPPPLCSEMGGVMGRQ